MKGNFSSFNSQDLIKEKEEKDNISSNESSNSITSLKDKANNILRIAAIFSSSIILLLIFLTILLYFLEGSSRNFQLLIFEYNSTYTPFQTHVVSIITSLIILFIFYLIITYSLVIRNEKDFMKIFCSSKFSKLFNVMNSFVIGILLITCIFKKNLFTSMIVLALLLCILLSISLIYKKVKTKKKLSPMALVGISIGMSVFLAFYLYLFLYDIGDLITCKYGEPYVSDNYKQIMAILVNVLYWGIAVILLSIYQDIVFSIFLLLIEIGYISNSANLAVEEITTGSCILGFIVVSIIITVMKYKKAVFGYDDNEVWIKDLENEWKENNSRNNNNNN